MEDGQNYDISSYSLPEGSFMRQVDDLSRALTGNTLYLRDKEYMLRILLLPLNLL